MTSDPHEYIDESGQPVRLSGEPGGAGLRGRIPRLKDANRPRKNLVITYVLCLVLGLLGAHKFYLGHVSAGGVYVLLTVAGMASASWGIGFIFGGLVIALCLLDLLLIPGHVRVANGDLN